jgi:hypothetical protein
MESIVPARDLHREKLQPQTAESPSSDEKHTGESCEAGLCALATERRANRISRTGLDRSIRMAQSR